MKQYLDQGLEKKEAMKAVAKDRGMTKREVYSQLLGESQELHSGMNRRFPE